jgi:hypothetical protein
MSDCIIHPNKPGKNGYVRAGRAKPGRERQAHRAAYVEAYGPIPEDLVVDHECHNLDLSCPGGAACRHRACINPEHLILNTRGNNILSSHSHPAAINASKTHCSNGHEYTPGNTYSQPNRNGRQCRMCKLIWRQEQIRRMRAIQWGLSDIGVLA